MNQMNFRVIDSSLTEIICIECSCGYHINIDFTYIDQVKDFKSNCPNCENVIDTSLIE